MKIELSESEVEIVREFIEANLFHCIKWDGITKIQNLYALLNVWYKCGGIYTREELEGGDDGLANLPQA